MTTLNQGQGASPQPSSRNSARNTEQLTGWLMASPAILLMLAFLIIPFLFAFGLAFTNQRLISPNPTEFVGLRNFKRLLTVRTITVDPILDDAGEFVFDDEGSLTYPRMRTFTRNNPDYPQLEGLQEWFRISRSGDRQLVFLAGDAVFMKALRNTLVFALVVVPVQGGLGLLLALIVNQKLAGVNVFRTLYFIPVVVSMVILSVLWSFIYDGNNGLLNSLLSLITFNTFEPIDWLGNENTALGAITGMSIWQGVGFHMVIWLAGLQTIPAVLYEAADVSGANRWQKFRYVTWPGLRNVFVFVLITITMAAFALFVQPFIMTRGGPLDSTTTVLHQMLIRAYDKQDIAYGSAISVFFFLMVLAVALLQRYFTRDEAE